jgi:integrase
LTVAQWELVAAELDSASTPATRRASRAIRWLYATGLRIAELTAARCADLERIEFITTNGAAGGGWLLTVLGKGEKFRQVPVPLNLVDELGTALEGAGHERDPRAAENREIPILANFEEQDLAPFTASGLYKAIKAVFRRCADQVQDLDAIAADRLRMASPHWLRHSHGTHALNGRPGHAPVPLQVVQNNLGHASIGTTSGYLQTELAERVAAMEGFWGQT